MHGEGVNHMTRHSFLRLAICNLVFMSIIIATYIGNNHTILQSYAASQDFPSQYFAPNVDATLAGNPFPDVISQASKVAGTKYYELGFITTKRGQCQASWGGVNSTNYMQGDIANLRAHGGDVILNFGGYAASNPDDPSVDPQQQEELALACPNVASLRAQYQKVINTYQVTHIAFAIEGNALSDPKHAASVILRDEAIAGLKSGMPGTKLCVEFTLTGTNTGLTDKGEVLLKDAIDKGINICLVNILAMNYGSSVAVDQPGAMGQYAIDAASETFVQLKYLFSKKLDSQVWSMMGVTIMNGVNNSSGKGGREIFSLSDVPALVQFAMKNRIRELSMRELHRDQPANGNAISPTDTVTATPTTNSGIQQKSYEFSMAFNAFTTSNLMCPSGQSGALPSNVNVPPASNGAVGVTTTTGTKNGSKTTLSDLSENTALGNPNCIGTPNASGTPNPGVIPNPSGNPGVIPNPSGNPGVIPNPSGNPGGPICSGPSITNGNIQSLIENNHSKLSTNTSHTGRVNSNSVVSSASNTANGRLGLLISKSSNQLQIGQVVTYQLTPCNVPLTSTQIIAISDTISGGLADLKATSQNWQVISNPAFSSGSTGIVAIYTGPRSTATTLPPLTFTGKLTATASPFVTSFGVIATLNAMTGALGPSASSQPLGPIGVSLNANITNWAVAVDTLSVLLSR
jgi:hypothetical protein